MSDEVRPPSRPGEADPRPERTADFVESEPELLETVSADIESPATPLAESRSIGYLGLRITQYALLFAGTLIVTRELGPVGRAQYALPLALSAGVWVLTHLTLELAASRLIARREKTLEQLAGPMALCLVGLSLIGIAVTLAIGLSQRTSWLAGATETMVLLAALTIPFLLASQMAGQMLIVRGLLRSHGAAAVAGAALQFVLVLGLAVTDSITPSSALAATLAGFATIGVLVIVLLARAIGPRSILPAADGSVLRPLLRTGATLHPASIAIQFTPRLDLILVAALLTAEDAGLYSLALILADSMLLASQALSMSAVPKQLSQEEGDAVRFTIEFARQSLLLTLVAVAVATPLAYPFIVGVYGEDFAGSVLPFVILLFGMAATAIEGPCRVLLIRIASPWVVSGLVCGSLAVNVVAVVLLIQVMSISGAALGALIGYWLLALATLWVVRQRTGEAIAHLFARPSGDDEIVRLARLAVARLRPAPSTR